MMQVLNLQTEGVDDVMIYELCLTPTPPSCQFPRHCLLFALAVSRKAVLVTLTGKEQPGTAVIQYELLLFALKSALRSRCSLTPRAEATFSRYELAGEK